ncbi:hypothetical protein ACFV0D_41250, partial [Streptomyces sp. NPDC059556]
GKPAEETSLPEAWERVVDRLPSAVQREVVRLVASGVSQREAARRLGLSRSWAVQLYQQSVKALRTMVIDQRLDPIPAEPPKLVKAPAAAGCSRPCATGCALRRREVAA